MKKIAAYFAFLMLLSGICSCGKAKTSEGPAPVYGNFSSSDASAGNSKAAAPEPSTDLNQKAPKKLIRIRSAPPPAAAPPFVPAALHQGKKRSTR